MSNKLVRVKNDAMIAGVCAGLARRFGVDPWLVRLGFFLVAWLGGSALLAYLILWVIIPQE